MLAAGFGFGTSDALIRIVSSTSPTGFVLPLSSAFRSSAFRSAVTSAGTLTSSPSTVCASASTARAARTCSASPPRTLRSESTRSFAWVIRRFDSSVAVVTRRRASSAASASRAFASLIES